MPEQISEGSFVKYLGPPISGGLGALLTWLSAGTTGIGLGLATFVAILCGIGGVIFSHIYRRYLGVLSAGARPKGSPARQAYDSLRESLSGGNMAARLYTRQLSAFLATVDRFFGDADMRHGTLLPNAFGLKAPAPLWTAPAFDRCLLLALLYPIATIFVVWAVSGHVGPAETALLLKPDATGWQRSFASATACLSVFASWQCLTARKGWLFAWIVIGMMAAVVSSSLAGSLVFATACCLVVGLAYNFNVTRFGVKAGTLPAALDFDSDRVGTIAVGVAVVGSISSANIMTGVTNSVAALLMSSAVYLVVAPISNKAIKHQRYGNFLLVFVLGMIVTCFGLAYALAPMEGWNIAGPVLLFLGLLTLLNAPFDWISLGLTRALLRRGLELGGWWPYLLALADALLAAVIVAVLAISMVIGVQAFDGLAAHGGGKPILPLDELFSGLATHRTAPEYWWIYALLLSTVIPSLVNLVIGGASLMRGLPGLPSLLLHFMPIGKAVPEFERRWIALVLTLQVFAGAILGIVAQALLVVVVIGFVMPWLSLSLLDMARDVAAFNLPLRVGHYSQALFK